MSFNELWDGMEYIINDAKRGQENIRELNGNFNDINDLNKAINSMKSVMKTAGKLRRKYRCTGKE